MSRPVNISDTVKLIPNSYTDTGSYNFTHQTIANAYSDADSTSSNRMTLARSNNSTRTSEIYYEFDKSSLTNIPSNATITSIAANVKYYVNSTSYVTAVSMQLYSNTAAKGTAVTSRPTSGTKYSITTGSWTRAELENIRLYISGTHNRSTNNGYIYFYGADVTINYSVSYTEYEITSTLATDAVDSIDPAGQTYVVEGNDYELSIYANSIDDFKVEDNGIDVTSQLVQHVNLSGGTLEKAPNSYETSGSISGTRYQSTVGCTVENPSSQSGSDYSSSSGSTANIDYIFDFSDIPNNATIDSVSVSVRGHLESTSNSSERADMQLYSGTSAKGSQISFTSTSNTILTFSDVGTWTREELQSAKLRFTIGYYGGLIVGITWTVTYSLPSSNPYYWTYSLNNVSADHTIVISDSIIEIPEEDPQYNYYPITISSINATTTPGRGTTRVVEGTNQTITIYPDDPSIALVTDNGVDITNQLVAHGGEDPTYTVTTPASADYNFTLNQSTGYYVSTNDGQDRSASVARVNFNLPVRCLITIQYINYAEAGYDYGMFGNIDTTVATDGLTAGGGSSSPSDSLNNYYYICSSDADNTTTPKTLTYEIESGEHFIDIKYGKDDATDNGNDSLQWKILSIEPLEANNYYTYTLSNIQESHSLIFIFGDVTYYFINSSGTGAKLFPSGSMVQLPGDGYSLTIVPDDYSYTITVSDNNTNVTSQVERKEETVTKEGNTYTVVNYIYRLTNIQATHNIVVSCSPNNLLYIKINGSWIEARRVYIKTNDRWNEVQDYTSLFSQNQIYVSGN